MDGRTGKQTERPEDEMGSLQLDEILCSDRLKLGPTAPGTRDTDSSTSEGIRINWRHVPDLLVADGVFMINRKIVFTNAPIQLLCQYCFAPRPRLALHQFLVGTVKSAGG